MNSRRVVMAVPPAWAKKMAVSLEFFRLEVIEARLCVGFGPQTDLAGLRERGVFGFEVLLAVEEALDFLAGHLYRERVPLAFLDLHLGVLKLGAALAGDDLVDAEVVFERVHAGDVVVVR